MARSDTFPQPTATRSKQRSGSQPETRRQSVAPLYRQSPSGLKEIHLNTHTHTHTGIAHVGSSPCDGPHLTGVAFPSREPIIWNFSRSHSLTLLKTQS